MAVKTSDNIKKLSPLEKDVKSGQMEIMKREMLKDVKSGQMELLNNEEESIYFESPTYDLNRILSGDLFKSVCSGNHLGLVGPEASGKSSLMAIFAADAQKKNYLPVIFDVEGAWSKKFCSRWGLDINSVIKLKSMWVDELIIKLASFIENKYEKLFLIIDSIGALDVKKVLEDGKKGSIKTDMGKLQREIKRMLKIIVSICKNQNSVCLSAGHYYGNSSGYGQPEAIGGGKYYRLSCDGIVSLKKSNIWENPNASGVSRGEILGNRIKAITLKNRLIPPFQEATVDINYREGVNSLAGLIDLAIDLEIIEKKGSWFICESLDIRTQGMNKFMKELKTKNIDKILSIINKDIKTKGYSSVNENIENAQEILEKEEK